METVAGELMAMAGFFESSFKKLAVGVIR